MNAQNEGKTAWQENDISTFKEGSGSLFQILFYSLVSCLWFRYYITAITAGHDLIRSEQDFNTCHISVCSEVLKDFRHTHTHGLISEVRHRERHLNGLFQHYYSIADGLSPGALRYWSVKAISGSHTSPHSSDPPCHYWSGTEPQQFPPSLSQTHPHVLSLLHQPLWLHYAMWLENLPYIHLTLVPSVRLPR